MRPSSPSCWTVWKSPHSRLPKPLDIASLPPGLQTICGPGFLSGPSVQIFRLRGKAFENGNPFIRRFRSMENEAGALVGTVNEKPQVGFCRICHEVEKLARAALFPASAAFAPVRSGQNYLGRRRSPSPPAGGKGARHDRGLHVKWGVGTFVRMVYCQRRKEEACGGSP